MASNIHCVAETTNVRAVHYANRIMDCVCDEDVDNGTFGHIEELVEDGGVIYKFVKGVVAGKKVLMAHNPEWTEDTSRMTNQRKDKFYIPVYVPFRGFTLEEMDEVSLSAEGFTGEPEVDKYVTVGDDGKLVIADAPVDGAVMSGKIMRKRQVGSTLVTGVRTYGYARMMYEVQVESLA